MQAAAGGERMLPPPPLSCIWLDGHMSYTLTVRSLNPLLLHQPNHVYCLNPMSPLYRMFTLNIIVFFRQQFQLFYSKIPPEVSTVLVCINHHCRPPLHGHRRSHVIIVQYGIVIWLQRTVIVIINNYNLL